MSRTRHALDVLGADLPWARWPWDRCPARHRYRFSCDLRKGHDGAHVAERGMDMPVWTEQWAQRNPLAHTEDGTDPARLSDTKETSNA